MKAFMKCCGAWTNAQPERGQQTNIQKTLHMHSQCKRWMDRDWIGIHQSTNPRLIHWWRGSGSGSNSHPFVALLRQRRSALITALTSRWRKRGELVHLYIK
jgi:hypothetical protein